MAEPGDRASTSEPRSPWLSGGFVSAAAFIGFIAVIGTVLAVTSDNSAESAPTAQAPAVRSTGPQPSGSVADGAPCPELSDERQDLPASAPAGVTWSLYDSVALPSSKKAGPALAGKDVARCYAHTPVGALLATSQISVRYLAADDWLEVTRTQTVGAGRDAYITDRTKAEATAVPDDDAGGGAHGQIAGFRFVTYNDTTAVVQTVWRFPDGRMQAATTTALWQEGDWRLEYPADPADPAPVDSLAGYIEWGGV
ncbi:hypothetical protein ACFVGN_34135 [Streptomyces sp. NPDC057757]|uniref:hypothetical protein n=1 Tax=Streptomyces sp. NPDC057757 TaxID=3346241 RepID=UPI00369BCBDF